MKGRQMTLPPRHHATHASKHVSSSGRGIPGDVPRKGILGAAAPGKVNSSDAPSATEPPLLSHFHRRPAAALYGSTAQWKKPAGPVNVLHKPFAGGDGHPATRKAAVHIGIPQAKTNIAVRCSWTNNPAVQRTVTEVPSSQPSTSAVKVYRVPTPPQCSSDTETECLPGCQEDLRRKLERMRLRASAEKSVFHFQFCRFY